MKIECFGYIKCIRNIDTIYNMKSTKGKNKHVSPDNINLDINESESYHMKNYGDKKC